MSNISRRGFIGLLAAGMFIPAAQSASASSCLSQIPVTDSERGLSLER